MKNKQYEYGHTLMQAFNLLHIKYNNGIKNKSIKPLILEGYSESGICYVIRKQQEYLCQFVGEHRFWSILLNEVRKNVRKATDTYWTELNKKQEYSEQTKNTIKLLNDRVNKLAKENLVQKQIDKSQFTGYVYFIQGESGGDIKIGYSENVDHRIKELQIGYPDKLVLLGKINGSYEIESKIHDELKKYQVYGEWFKPCKQVIDTIKKYMDELGVPTHREIDTK